MNEFVLEFKAVCRALPTKRVMVALLAAWALMFHFVGNSTFGYINSASLFRWLHNDYSHSPDDEHGYLIPVVVVVILWMRRQQLIALPKRAWWGGLAFVGIGIGLHVLGFMIQQTRLSLIGFFAGMYGIIGMVLGPAILRAIFFPYFLFAFCIPLSAVSESITFPLRLLVTGGSVWFSNTILGLKVMQDGTMIFDAAKTFEYDVAPACSGIRSLTALLALTTIYGFMNFTPTWKRLLVVAAAVPLAVLGNMMRLLGIIVIAEAFGQNAGMKFHDNAGFVTFLVALGGVFGLGWLLREKDPAVAVSVDSK